MPDRSQSWKQTYQAIDLNSTHTLMNANEPPQTLANPEKGISGFEVKIYQAIVRAAPSKIPADFHEFSLNLHLPYFDSEESHSFSHATKA